MLFEIDISFFRRNLYIDVISIPIYFYLFIPIHSDISGQMIAQISDVSRRNRINLYKLPIAFCITSCYTRKKNINEYYVVNPIFMRSTVHALASVPVLSRCIMQLSLNQS